MNNNVYVFVECSVPGEEPFFATYRGPLVGSDLIRPEETVERLKKLHDGGDRLVADPSKIREAFLSFHKYRMPDKSELEYLARQGIPINR